MKTNTFRVNAQVAISGVVLAKTQVEVSNVNNVFALRRQVANELEHLFPVVMKETRFGLHGKNQHELEIDVTFERLIAVPSVEVIEIAMGIIVLG